jgi:hypothetical protein
LWTAAFEEIEVGPDGFGDEFGKQSDPGDAPNVRVGEDPKIGNAVAKERRKNTPETVVAISYVARQDRHTQTASRHRLHRRDTIDTVLQARLGKCLMDQHSVVGFVLPADPVPSLRAIEIELIPIPFKFE